MLNYFPAFSAEFATLPYFERAIEKHLINFHAINFNVGVHFIYNCELCKNTVNRTRCKVINQAT